MTCFFTERWKVKSNSSRVLGGWEAGGLDAALAAVALPRGGLGGQQRLREALIAPLLLAGSVGELRQRSGGRWRFQQPEQVRELAGGLCHRLVSDQLVVAGGSLLDLRLVGPTA